MIYEITGFEFHGILTGMAVFIVGLILVFFSKRKSGETGIVELIIGVILTLGGAYGIWVLGSQSIFNYLDYINGKMKTDSISGVIESFSSDGTDRFIKFESGNLFKYRVYRNTECLLYDISSLRGVEIGKKARITFRVPQGRDYVDCVLKIEVKL